MNGRTETGCRLELREEFFVWATVRADPNLRHFLMVPVMGIVIVQNPEFFFVCFKVFWLQGLLTFLLAAGYVLLF